MRKIRTTGRVALVTGASSGLGQSTARLLSAKGFRVFGTSRRAHVEVRGVEMLQLDLSAKGSVHRCVEEVLARAGRIDLLVNNAGAMHEGFAEETTMEEARAVFETNFFGVAHLIDAVMPGMRAARSGHIINIGSLAAWVGEPGEGFYAASKAALARYTEALRHEVWHLGISVSLVEPGAFASNVLQSAAASDRTIADYDGARESARERLHQSMHAAAGSEEVASVVFGIARSKRPRVRYGAGRGGRAVPYLKVMLPQRLFDRVLRRSFGLPARPTGRRRADA